jgi:hypothetical protein
MNSVGDVRRVNFGYFIRPPEETGTGQPRVEPVLGSLIRHAERWLLFDSGIGGGHEDRRRTLPTSSEEPVSGARRQLPSAL